MSDKTYIHKDGWLFGLLIKNKPNIGNYDFTNVPNLQAFLDGSNYESDLKAFKADALLQPKVKWTGPILPEWKEMVEGVDFELTQCDCDKYMSGKRKCDRTDGPFRAPLCSIAIPLQQSQPAESGDVMKPLIDAMEAKGVKCSFGLTPDHIAVIEKHLKLWEGNVYSEYMWIDIGKQIGWHPLTAMCWYLREMREATQSPSTSGEKLYREVRATDGLPDDKHDKHLIVHGANWTGWYDREKELWLTDSNETFESDQVTWLKPYTPLPDAGREAIAFVKWVEKEGWTKFHDESRYYQTDWKGDFNAHEGKTEEELYALFSSRPVESSFGEWLEKYCDPHKNNAQPFICLKCKRIHESEPEQCECGGKTFQKTHPSSRPVQVSPSINEQHLIAAARYGFKYATESQTHNDESVPDGNVLQWWQWYQTQPEFKGVQVSEEQEKIEKYKERLRSAAYTIRKGAKR